MVTEKIKMFTTDKGIAWLFMMATIVFIVALMTHQPFFDWAFHRHHNQWSWYLRPLFLIPFCYFAYRHSWAGISITICGIFTSMFWFNPPAVVPENVHAFLQFEKDWLYGAWDYKKIGLVLTVPLSFFALGLAFWKRSIMMGLAVVALMASGKVMWSIHHAGEAGKAILIPAAVGLGICGVLLYCGFKRLEKRK